MHKETDWSSDICMFFTLVVFENAIHLREYTNIHSPTNSEESSCMSDVDFDTAQDEYGSDLSECSSGAAYDCSKESFDLNDLAVPLNETLDLIDAPNLGKMPLSNGTSLNLFIYSKILEKVVTIQLNNHLEKFCHIEKFQSAYQGTQQRQPLFVYSQTYLVL